MAVWAVVFSTCAVAGAFVAARMDVFAPDVARPSSSATGAPSPAKPAVQRWVGTIVASSQHDFYVGGSCLTTWRTVVRLRMEGGEVAGSANALPVGDPRCDFPQAQVQSRQVKITIGGRYTSSGVIVLQFGDVTSVPPGSGDVGGFLTFLDMVQLGSETTDGRAAHGEFHKVRDDGNRGTYRFEGRTDLRCKSGCQPVTGS